MIELSENISNYIQNVFGDEFLAKYKAYVESDYIQYVRIPGTVNEQNNILDRLVKYGIELSNVENVPNAYSLISGSDKIGKTLEHALGKYYIQSLSSMIPPFILNPTDADTAIDMCAAPGSKATQLSEMMGNAGTLYVNEPSIGRTKSLAHNLDKLNVLNAGMLTSKGELISKYFDNYFDKILIDAPCTGLGIVQKKQEVSNWWSEDHTAILSDLQFKLLVSGIKSAKIGAEIVYSTCTLTLEENELVVERILDKYPVELMDIELPVKSHPGITKYGERNLNPELAKTRRIIPWEINSEGFFIAKFKKISETEPSVKMDVRQAELEFLSWNHKTIKEYVENIADWYGIDIEILKAYKFLFKSNEMQFIKSEWHSDNLSIFARAGLKLGKLDKHNNIVLHTLAAQALQKHITKNVIEFASKDELKIYLNGGTIKTMTEVEPKGRKVVSFNGDMIGGAIATKDGLKSQFPRALRTAEILF
ncbi:MAG: RsmB/NOP family class I SAM-dependent RNA methyltransferase [Bacteroidetes bacterium]|nr:RsmB/NOP family class I SAM-dependent RNA methyltransferase [Bacteroidota bacterium]MBU1115713.1 RsmB/NOP family class I SAM-dependent RNA methyltransferase [Bacteroidota bacterium]MBU1799930.1 RsmB/NOP family class I SAM-dependent RNA methyltransferase [Bacteroidota bacterium]